MSLPFESIRRILGSPRLILIAIVATAIACSSLAVAAVFTSEEGRWPETWPEELEVLRPRAVTYTVATSTEEQVHDIPFDDRDEFERLWPFILTVATSGAPITIVSGPSGFFHTGPHVPAGVRIKEGRDHVSLRIKLPENEGGWKEFSLTKPWPKHFFDADGTPPAYLGFDNAHHKWDVPNENSKFVIRYRVRTEITLIVDENIVDLSRIDIPDNVTVIDRRSKESSGVQDE